MSHQPTVALSRRQFLGLGAALAATSALTSCSVTEEKGDASSSTPQITAFPPTEDYVRHVGRTFQEDGVTWLAQSGSAIEFVASSKQVFLDMVGDDSVSNEPDLRPRFAVLVDGEVIVDDTLCEPQIVVEVPLVESTAGAIVEVIHLSEASRGAVGVRAIRVESDSLSSVRPTAQKDLHIGFIGDSITCAYGVEAAGNDDPFKTTTQNFMKSFAYLAAQELCADYDTVCYSGYGIVSGWSGDGERNERMLMPPLYELVVEGHDDTWDFAAHPSDVVVINLGTNDFTYTGTDETRMEEFSQGYAEFLASVRELNPDSLIICTLGTMWGCEALYPALERAVHIHADRTGDERVLCYLSDPIDMEADGCGTGGHPNEVVQRKIADALVGVIHRAWDQQGP